MPYVVNRYVQNIMAAIENTDLWDEPKVFSMPLLDSDSLTTFNAASVGTESTSGTLMRYNSDPNQDKWPIWEACILGASEYTLSSWLYVHLLGMSVGETLWFYNARFGRANAIGFKKVTSSAGGTTAAADIIVRVSSTNYGYAGSVVVGGTDSSSRIRQFAFTAITDNDNHYAIPIYFFGARHDPMQNGDNVRPQLNAFTNSVWLSVRTGIYTLFSDIYVPPQPSVDPYDGGGTSTGTDTPTGEFDDSSESVPLPSTWGSFGAGYSKLVTQYVLSQSDMIDLASWLWYGNTVLDNLKRWFNNPFEAIISLGMLPFTPSDTTDYNVFLGGVDAETKGKKVNDQIEKISMGSVTLNGYYGAAWDYNPFTKIELYLPYCGVVGLNPDEVMNHTISVDYYCDSFSGDCVAFVSDEDRVLQTVKGNCFVPIPIMGRDFTSVYSSALGAVATIAGLTAAAATGGLSAPMAAGLSTSIAGNVLAAKTHVTRASSVGGMSGFMSIQNPYMIITFPRQCLPELQNDHQGYPLFVTKALNEFSGYTKVHEIHLDGLDATAAEQKEIYDLLKGGVIL